MKYLAALFAIALAVTVVVAEPPEDRNAPNTGYYDTPVIPGQKWKVHDQSRPQPVKVTAGAKPGDAPSDAIVLFDGKDLSHWTQRGKDGKERAPRWKVENGYLEVVPGTGDLISKDTFGDAQYHLEWAAPSVIDGASQWRGNSGVWIQNHYEMQILDSWNNPTYPDGSAGSIYGQWPPMVNPSRKPGEWQTFDIAWEAPRFENGKIVSYPYVTLFYNGVLVQNHRKVVSPVGHRVVPAWIPHGLEEPLLLQDHDTKPRFRNIWARKLKGYDQQ